MSTLPSVELGVLGPFQVRQGGAPVTIPGAKPRAILSMLGLHGGSVVAADTLVELLWGEDPPRTAAKALQTHISSLRRTLGDGFVLTAGTGWTLAETQVDAARYRSAARLGRDAAATGDTSQAVARFEEALALWRGIPELPDSRRGASEKTRWIEGHAALVEDRADALLATGRAAEIIGELEAAVTDAPLRERRWGQLMLALYRAGRQGEALGAYQRARALLADELGVDPGPDLRRLEAAIVAQDPGLEVPATQQVSSVTRAVTFLLTDIEGSTAAWEADAEAMAVALARHDELVEQVVTSRGGRLIKTRGEGDATFSVFERPSAAAAAAVELQEAIVHEPWELGDPMRIRVALHTGEVELRDGDYFGRAVNRAARLRSLATGGQILCSGATAELVIDSLPDDLLLADLGTRQLRNLARPEHVFELRLQTTDDSPQADSADPPLERPSLPAVFAGPGPFVGRGHEFGRLSSAWQTALAGGTNAVLIAGEPGVGKTRLAGEWSRQAYERGALVIYGRCDEDLGAPYQPFAEALRSLVPCLGSRALRGLRGVEALLPLVPGLTEVLPDLAAPTRADPDTERYALFDAVVALLGIASARVPVVLILDDLHWAAKPTLLLLRHLLRFGEHARVQIIGTYRSTDLDRSHPLAAMLADLHRDGTATRLSLSGLDEDDVTTYVAEAGYDDEELARALATVTGGNPFFLIEALRHVDESGGRWDQSTLPQGVREAVSRRLSRLAPETNKALATAAVVGSRFALELVERVVGDDLVDAFDEACKAGIVIEEPGGRYRFNHALLRQSLLAELPSVRRMRLHQRIAATLETEPGSGDERLAELAYHYFECAWAGNAAKAVEYCRRAADQAMARLAYEGAADLYDRALHALEEIDDELPDRDDQTAELLVARCEALLAAGDVASAAGTVSQLQGVTVDSARLAAWATCFDGQLSMLIHPERLDDVEAALGAAAAKLAELDDAAGEAKAHTVRAGCLARLGRIGDCEIALDNALTAARRARDHRRVNAVLAGAPLAALWGPNPVPRAGGRCLDVVRLLRITTDSPAVEATSTRCQALLEAFRGRTAAARRMIDSARRTVTELGLRHALLEVEQFAGIVELVAGDPGTAEVHLRKSYNGFRRMGLDADTAETAALLGRTCLALDRGAEADELCTESERLAGHALKASIAWRTLRAQLLSRGGDHEEARRVAEAAVALAERTDLLVDHGDACLTLATVLGAAGDAAGARAAAERAVGLYGRKGATALAEKASAVLGETTASSLPPEKPIPEPTNACVQVSGRLIDAVNRQAWDEVAQLLAPYVSVESRRKIVGFSRTDVPAGQWPQDMRRYLETGMVRYRHTVLAVRGERLALMRLEIGTTDLSSGAPQDDMFQVVGIDDEGRIALQVKFDVEDIDAAMAELDATYARFEELQPPAGRLENPASRVAESFQARFLAGDWDAVAQLLADDYSGDDRRTVVGGGFRPGRDALLEDLHAVVQVGVTKANSYTIATRGKRLALIHAQYSRSDEQPEPFRVDFLQVVEIDADDRIVRFVAFDIDDIDGAFEDLDARYLAGEAATHSSSWSVIASSYAAFNRQEVPAWDWVTIDHRRGTPFQRSNMTPSIRTIWDLTPGLRIHIEAVHRLDNWGAIITHKGHGTSHEGFDAEWRAIDLLTVDGGVINRCEVFDEADLDAALARFEQLSQPTARRENRAARVFDHVWSHFASGNWDAVAETVADNYVGTDHRRVVSAETQHGRGQVVRDLQAAAEVGFTISMVSAIAIRGARLVLARVRASGRDPDAIQNDALNIVEIDGDDRIANVVTYDVEDFDAAIAQLEVQYVAGEAAPYADTWKAITGTYASVSRREFPVTTPGWLNIDHRRAAAFAPGELDAYIRAGWDLDQEIRAYIEAVHKLEDLGAVVTHAAYGTSREGFDAEWHEVAVVTVEGAMVNRTEFFDEGDIHAALGRFEQLSRPMRRLENTASQTYERMQACFVARDWDALADTLLDDVHNEDCRRVVNAGVQRGRDAAMGNVRWAADLGITHATSDVVATRGERLVLTHARFLQGDEKPETFHVDVLQLVEIDADERIAALIMFDLDDFDGAFAELDARYIAGEGAAHARTWSVITGCFAALSRHELPSTTPDLVDVDRRRGAAFAPGELMRYLRAGWEINQEIRPYVEAVHRLSNLGTVVTHAARLTSREGFEAEWRTIDVLTVDGDKINRCELFDEADLDAALARFKELHPSTRQLQNTATRVCERLYSHVTAGEWHAVAEITAENVSVDDRRRVVNAGILHGRDANIKDAQATVDVGFAMTMLGVLATRGRYLALTGIRVSGRDPEAIQNDALEIIETDADEKIVAVVIFDLDDFDAAIAELDAHYIAGEAAGHSQTWSVIAGVLVAHNRREVAATTPDVVTIDHRRVAGFAPGAGFEYIRAGWEVDQSLNIYVEAAHQVNDLGAVFTWAGHGTSHEGFEAEWRGVTLMTVDGQTISRMEVFDEVDLEAALATFDQLSRPAPQLENAASQAYERMWQCFRAQDWVALTGLVADDELIDDRRRVVNGGMRHGRDAGIEELQAAADVGFTITMVEVKATRGDRLVLTRVLASGRDPDAVQNDVLQVVEIDSDQRIARVVTFDLDDFEDAIAEIDARYLVGEAASHSQTWSVIAAAYAGFNRREFSAKTPEWVSIDHRRGARFAPGEFVAYVEAAWEDSPDTKIYIRAVHRLTTVGAVVTHQSHGISQEGFDAEWRDVHLLALEGDKFSRSELFDERDLDAATARFEQLSAPAPHLENAASQAIERFMAHFASRDWDAMADALADDHFNEDRRGVVNAGHHRGRDAELENFRLAADVGCTHATSNTLATRGVRLALARARYLRGDQESEAFHVGLIQIVEIDTDERIAAFITFDPDDFEAATAELDARYIAGEAAAHAHTWSAIVACYTALNRREIPATTTTFVNVDHRRVTPFATGDVKAYTRAAWNQIPDIDFRIETVHRLSDLGAVITQALRGTSQEGFEAEWREIHLMTLEGNLFNRSEFFDEADVDAALARFDQLSRPAPMLENAASQAYERFRRYFAARDWAAMAELLTADTTVDDHRRIVNAETRRGRDVEIKNMRAFADIGAKRSTSTVVATRGERLVLCRTCISDEDHEVGGFRIEMLIIVETTADKRILARVAYDPDDFEAAIAEIDARYLVGEAASHSQTWVVITQAYAALNRHELPPTTQGLVSIDHRRGAGFAPGDLIAYVRAALDLAQDGATHVETAHRLTDLGAVVTHVTRGTSQEGFDAEWRELFLFTLEGDVINRCELFDEADLEAALARFDELAGGATT